MDLIINRLKSLNIKDPACVVADCADNGRLPWLMDYIAARERLYDMEVDIYVRL